MKTKLVLSSLLSFVFYLLSSQVPQGFTYQAIARDVSGNAIANQSLPVRLTIQSDSLGGTTFWIEEHSSVATNNLGLFTLVLGKGEKKAGSSVSSFNKIDWSVIPKFIKTEIYYGGWKYMGTSRLWSVPYSMVAGDINDTLKKLIVKGETDLMDEALFEVKNKKGQTVFAVYNEGVRIYVDDGKAKGTTKGGFAIGGLDAGKNPGQEYFRVTRDSTRVYVNDETSKGTTKGGFAIGGFDNAKTPGHEYLRVTPDSTRVYVNDNNSKGTTKGGFAIGGLDAGKSPRQEYLLVTRDSTRIYVNNTNGKGTTKGGFAIGGFDPVKAASEEYLRVTSDSVKVSKSLLIPRLTTYERDHLSFIPGEALIIFNITDGCMQIFKNSVWSNIWCFNCAPAFLIQPVDKIICSSETAVFSVSATGTSLSYQWQQSTDNGSSWNNILNGGLNPKISGAQTYTLSLSNVPVGNNNFMYRCTISGSCPPNIISNPALLNVGSKPVVITTQPSDHELTMDCKVTYSLESPGFGLSYQWQHSIDGGSTWNNISDGGISPVYSGTATPSLSLSNIPLSIIGHKYRCIVGNSCGDNLPSAITTLTANTSPEITVQPSSQWLLAGHNTTFNLSASGSGILFQWQESTDGGGTWNNVNNGGSTPSYTGANDSVLLLSNIPVTHSGHKFRCVLSHFCRPAEISTAATLTIISSGSATDIDGNTYNTVTIGSQVWMAENLKTTKYNDGSTIPWVINNTTWKNLSTPAYCWYENEEVTYKNEEGALYNWFTVNTGKLCPTGWHVPTDADWHSLVLTLDPDALNEVLESQIAGGKLKEAGIEHWLSPNIGATNEVGFTARPSGRRDTGYFFNINNSEGYWWSSTEEDASNAKDRAISNNSGYIFLLYSPKTHGFPVRCLKDPVK